MVPVACSPATYKESFCKVGMYMTIIRIAVYVDPRCVKRVGDHEIPLQKLLAHLDGNGLTTCFSMLSTT